MTTIIRTLRLFRDQETNNYGDENYHELTYDRDYEGRIESVGHIDRSIAWPPGDGFRVSDAAVSLADTDRNVRALFDANPTPRRRKGEIKVFQDTDTSDTVDPVYTGEIVPAPFGPGRATIQLRDAVFSWLDKPIWVLGTRDNFPNLPSGVEQEVIPAVFGRLESTATDLPQGKFRCPYVDTINFRYAVARHEIFEFIAAYRKRVNDGYFTVVDPGEYDIVTDTVTIEGISYTMTFIEFHAQQEDGTEIRCDASGINSRPAIGSLTALSGVEITNLVDHLLNVVYASEKRDDHYNDTNFAAVRSEITSRGWVFAYAMTDAMTNRDLIALMTACGLDFFCNRNGELDVAIDPLTDDPDAEDRLVLTEDDILLKNNPQEGEQPDPSFIPANPSEVHNRLRVFYAPYNGMPAAPGSAGNWGFQWIIDNTADQDELAVNPDDPTDLSKEEISVEYPFIHDDDTALAVAEERLGYYTLRSWSCEFDLSLIDFYDRIELAQLIGVTHRDGIKQESGGFIFGWINESMKVVALSYDLDRMTIHVTCVKHIPGADLTLEATFDPDSGHPARDTQTSVPPISNVSVNTTTVSTANFNDTTPAAPNGKRNVKWQHSGSNVSAYVDNFGTVNAQTGTSYTVADTDEGKLVTLSNGSAIAVTLPTSFASTYKSFMKNLGAGTATLTPSSGTINGSANITLTTGNGAILFFDGTNWKAITTGGGGSTSPLTTKGDVWGYSSVDARIPIGSNTTVLKADSAQTLGLKWEAVKESELTLTDITTNNVTSSQHGFAPKSPADATQFLNGATTPAFAQVKDSDLSTSDITTNNVTSSKHGFTPKAPADATKFLNGDTTPAFAQVKDSDLSTSDITTNNASTSKHGFLKKLDNDGTHFMDGTGAWSTPTGTGGGMTELTYDQITSDVTVNGSSGSPTTVIGPSTSHSYDGSTVVLIEFYTAAWFGGNQSSILELYEDSTLIGRIAQIPANGITQVHSVVRRTPSNASHTYTVKGWVNAGGSGAAVAGSSTYTPAFIRVVTKG